MPNCKKKRWAFQKASKNRRETKEIARHQDFAQYINEK